MQKTLNVRDGMYVTEAARRLAEMGVCDGERINVRFRVKKQKKFKSFRVSIHHGMCEYCGSWTKLTFRNSSMDRFFDDHNGVAFISPNDLK
jgi:Fe2+ transport system protein FeoA